MLRNIQANYSLVTPKHLQDIAKEVQKKCQTDVELEPDLDVRLAHANPSGINLNLATHYRPWTVGDCPFRRNDELNFGYINTAVGN